MEDFIFHTPTEILFGKEPVKDLGKKIKEYGGSRVLLGYGGGSIKRNGIYDQVVEVLKFEGLEFKELAGIEPNPHLDTAEKGIQLVRDNDLDFILPVGGGSTIDCCKLIAAGSLTEGDPWDIVLGKTVPEKVLPLGVILTLAATGSEMNSTSVITNTETQEKLGWSNPKVLPKFSVMNPEFTYTVNAWHTAAGTADIMSHTMENYFSVDDSAFVQDSMAEGILRTCVKYGPVALEKPDSYEARANLLWAGTWAINGLLSLGKAVEWSVHAMEHELSAFYDLTHGVGLAILTPRWLNHCLNDQTQAKIVRFGREVFHLDLEDSREGARQAIQTLYDFFEDTLNIPMSLKAVDIGEEHLDEMAQACMDHADDKIKGFQDLTLEDVKAIYKASLDDGID